MIDEKKLLVLTLISNDYVFSLGFTEILLYKNILTLEEISIIDDEYSSYHTDCTGLNCRCSSVLLVLPFSMTLGHLSNSGQLPYLGHWPLPGMDKNNRFKETCQNCKRNRKGEIESDCSVYKLIFIVTIVFFVLVYDNILTITNPSFAYFLNIIKYPCSLKQL